ncbi:MAG: zinc ribbon domain-containing protein [Caldisericaceae bacterium]
MYIKLLWELEQMHQLTQQKEVRVKEIQEELKIEEEIKGLENQIAESNSLVESFLKRKRELESEKEAIQSQLVAINEGLENNKFKNAKELKIAKKNQETLVVKSEEINRNLNFVIAEIEEKKAFQKSVSDKIDNYKEKIASVQQEYEKLEREIAFENEKYEKEFAAQSQSIPFSILHRYLEIQQQFPHGAIATVEHGHCSYCGAMVPLEVLEKLKNESKEEVIQCEVCGKILYLPSKDK